MNIAFFGTSDRSTAVLEGLKNSKYNLNLCITKDDVKVGRDRKPKPTAVKDWSIKNRVHFVTTDSFNTIDTELVINKLNEHNIQLIVVADFSYVIPKEIFNFPEYKTINIHFSLLPNYRGASPVQFTILNNERIAGISYQIMVEKMDAGPIIYQSKHKLDGDETTNDLYNKLFKIAGNELPNVIKNYIDGKYKPKKQNDSKATYTYSSTRPNSTLVYKEDAKINWNKSDKEIHAMIRAFNPWPVAWTTLKGINDNKIKIKNNKDLNKTVKIYDAKFKNDELEIKTVQIQGKNKISWKDFVNGYCEI